MSDRTYLVAFDESGYGSFTKIYTYNAGGLTPEDFVELADRASRMTTDGHDVIGYTDAPFHSVGDRATTRHAWQMLEEPNSEGDACNHLSEGALSPSTFGDYLKVARLLIKAGHPRISKVWHVVVREHRHEALDQEAIFLYEKDACAFAAARVTEGFIPVKRSADIYEDSVNFRGDRKKLFASLTPLGSGNDISHRWEYAS